MKSPIVNVSEVWYNHIWYIQITRKYQDEGTQVKVSGGGRYERRNCEQIRRGEILV